LEKYQLYTAWCCIWQCVYFDLLQMELLDGVRGKVLSRVSYHEWASDEYTSLDWVELVFSDGSQICLHLGCGEPSVEVLGCFDPEKERAEMFEMFGEKCVTVNSSDRSGTRKWRRCISAELTGYRTEETGAGLVSSVTLFFGRRPVRISVGADSLEVGFPVE